MKRYFSIPIICMIMVCIGCTGANKMRVPMAEIDRPIVDPKGTWSSHPLINAYLIATDTVTYRGVNWVALLFPTSAYSLTNNLSIALPSNSLRPTLTWQLTKSPLIDSGARYKWQIALSADYGMNGAQANDYYGSLRIITKKLLSNSVWYSGGIYSFYKRLNENHTIYGNIFNGLGFQVSEKADVVMSLGLTIPDYHKFTTREDENIAAYGNFNFHYSFVPWFGINIGSSLGTYKGSTQMEMSGSTEFYW